MQVEEDVSLDLLDDPEDVNLATNQEVANRVCAFVRDRVRDCSEYMEPFHRRWRLTFFMLAGNTIDQAGPMEVHVPELYKMVETMAPRIEEAVLERDPWFRVRPRRQEDEHRAETIAAFLDWELDQAQFRMTIQEAVRDLLVTQVCAYKVLWDHRTRRAKQRVEYDDPNTGEKKTKSVWRTKVVYSGPKYQLIDPFDFLIDPRATNPQDAEYVGDISYYTIEQLKHFEQQGFITNVDQLKDEANARSSLGWDKSHYKAWRSAAERSTTVFQETERRDGMPGKIEVATFCCQYDLRGDGVFEECILIVGNGRVCLSARKNWTSHQIRPYATARAARNGHNFFGTGVLDNAVRLNQHLDRLHAITIRIAEGVGCPMVFAEEDSDIPDSLYHTRPFKVIKGAGRITMQSVPDGALAAMPNILAMMSRNIEETVGTFKIQMGQEQTGSTATQSTLALQEGNRRLRGLVRNFSHLLQQILCITDKMNQDFVQKEVAFTAIGKRAKHLDNRYLEVGPSTFLEAVDFEIVGLESLHTYGLRATGFQQILTQAAPIIAANPGRIDQVGIFHALTSSLIGPDEADRYIKVMPARDDRMSQEAENMLLEQGVPVQVSQDDPHSIHIQETKRLIAKLSGMETVKPEVWQYTMQHLMQHEEFERREVDRRAIMDREREMNGLPPPQIENGQANGAKPPVGGFEADLMPQGQNPGPPDGRKQGVMGRSNPPIAQTDNQERR